MFFSRFRKKRAIKKYCHLSRHLKKRYGGSESYTFMQVKKTAEIKKVSNKYMEYLYALYLDSSEFSNNVSSNKTYDKLRSEIAELYFYGDNDFTFKDILKFVSPFPWGGGRVDIVRTQSGTFRQ
ncbi:MAG: DUF6559 family protein [Candidatus Hodarchaeota archaeon]